MSTTNPLDQLRRRIGHGSAPVAFAALAEEHRRAGRLDEAVTVCREGLERYPTYASARVTLGRALLDLGSVREAVAELEDAVAQAPDNLAASRALEVARTRLAELPPDERELAAPDSPQDVPHGGEDTAGDPAAALHADWHAEADVAAITSGIHTFAPADADASQMVASDHAGVWRVPPADAIDEPAFSPEWADPAPAPTTEAMNSSWDETIYAPLVPMQESAAEAVDPAPAWGVPAAGSHAAAGPGFDDDAGATDNWNAVEVAAAEATAPKATAEPSCDELNPAATALDTPDDRWNLVEAGVPTDEAAVAPGANDAADGAPVERAARLGLDADACSAVDAGPEAQTTADDSVAAREASIAHWDLAPGDDLVLGEAATSEDERRDGQAVAHWQENAAAEPQVEEQGSQRVTETPVLAEAAAPHVAVASSWAQSLDDALAEVFADAADSHDRAEPPVVVASALAPVGRRGPSVDALDRELEGLQQLLSAVRARRAALAAQHTAPVA